MRQDMSRTLVETIVKKTLIDMKKDPERSIRNLVDTAMTVSSGRFQKDFLQVITTMLQKEDSAYYALLRDVVSHVETQRLFTFGMNLGYNSCTIGAAKIRAKEEALSCRIPWAIQLELGSDAGDHLADYRAVLEEGERLGVYTWLLFPRDSLEEAFRLAGEYPDSAFFLFCSPDQVTDVSLDFASELWNLMPVIRCETDVERACGEMRTREMLYSVYYPYNQREETYLLNGDSFLELQQLSPAFTVLVSDAGCPDMLRNAVYQAVVQARTSQRCRTILIDLERDMEYIDHIISDDVCTVRFDERGSLLKAGERSGETGLLFQKSLTEILQWANPKRA